MNSKSTHDAEKDYVGELLIFEIFLNNFNEMATSIELRNNDFSHF